MCDERSGNEASSRISDKSAETARHMIRAAGKAIRRRVRSSLNNDVRPKILQSKRLDETQQSHGVALVV